MLGCYETLISHTVKTTLLWFHIIKVHIFFGGVWQLSALFFLRGVEKEQIMIFHPWWWGCWGGRSSIELTVFGIGKSSCWWKKYCYHQLRLGSVSHDLQGFCKKSEVLMAGFPNHQQYETYSVQTYPDDECGGVFPYLLLCFAFFFSN